MSTNETRAESSHRSCFFGCAPRSGRSDLRRGGIVVAVGLWLLASRLHIGGLDYSDSWPFLLILIGAVMAIFPSDRKGPWSGLMLILWGGLAIVAVNKLWGFGWFNIWPLFLVAVGLEMVINAIVQQKRPHGSSAGPHD